LLVGSRLFYILSLRHFKTVWTSLFDVMIADAQKYKWNRPDNSF